MFKPLQALWTITRKGADFVRLSEEIKNKKGEEVNEVIIRMMRNRDLRTGEDMCKFLYGSLEDLYSPWDLKDMERAVRLLTDKLNSEVPIRIFGDYDVDGIASSYILESGLKRLGGVVDVRLPHRIRDGYGVQMSMIRQAFEQGIDTILTCDNGARAVEEFALAKELGMTVIITDHHEYSEDEDSENGIVSPPHDAMINPHQPDCPYPNKDLCGAGVALKLITALYQYFRIPDSELEEFYVVAAIATVADVVRLQDENRILVKYGLERLPYTSNMGLQALLKELSLQSKNIRAYDIGFRIGPCLNACGRLESADQALDLLRCSDPVQAKQIAEHLVLLNNKRKGMTEEKLKEAIALVEASIDHNENKSENNIENNADMPDGAGPDDSNGRRPDGSGLNDVNESDSNAALKIAGIDRVLVVYWPDCHESLAGIIAGKLKSRYYRPAYVITDAREGVTGSGRSIDEYDMYRELDHLDKMDHLFSRYGGHKKAAGLSMDENRIDDFRFLINQNCRLTQNDVTPKLKIDLVMPLANVTWSLVDQLSLLEPFGEGNSRPVFVCRNLRVKDVRVLGRESKVVRMKAWDDSMQAFPGRTIDAVYFGDEEIFMDELGNRSLIYAVYYYPEINDYRGSQNLQIVIKGYIMKGPDEK